MKNSADLGGCYPPRPSASVDNTLLDLQNSSYPAQPHSIIAKLQWNSLGLFFDGGFECSTAKYLAYFFYCVFKEAVFISSLYKVCCECTLACIEELIC